METGDRERRELFAGSWCRKLRPRVLERVRTRAALPKTSCSNTTHLQVSRRPSSVAADGQHSVHDRTTDRQITDCKSAASNQTSDARLRRLEPQGSSARSIRSIAANYVYCAGRSKSAVMRVHDLMSALGLCCKQMGEQECCFSASKSASKCAECCCNYALQACADNRTELIHEGFQAHVLLD